MAACLAATGLLAGCSSSSPGAGSTDRTIASTPHPSSSASSPAPTVAQLGVTLETIAVHDADLHSGYSVRLESHGKQVTDQVTLDNCGYDFTTEADRVARREYYVVHGSGDTGLGNEVVAYDTPAHAQEAVAQWHTAAASCPHTAVRSAVAGVPKMRITIKQNTRDLGGLPATNNDVTEESATSAHDGTFYLVAILQVHGRYLDAVYLSTQAPVTAGDRAAATALAIVTGRRLVVQD